MSSVSLDLATEDLSLKTANLALRTESLLRQKNSDPNQTEDFTRSAREGTTLSPDPNQTANLTQLREGVSYQKILQAFKALPCLKYQLQGEEHTFILNRPEITIGRVAKNDLCLNGKNLSRIHCKIFRIRHQWFIEDCGSFNGTFANQHRLAHQEKYLLSTNATIRLGEMELHFFLPRHGLLPVSSFQRFLEWFPGVLISILMHTIIFYLLAQILVGVYRDPPPPPLKITLEIELISKEDPIESVLNKKIFETFKPIEETEVDVSPEVAEVPLEMENIPTEEPVLERVTSEVPEQTKPAEDFAWTSERLLGTGLSLPKGTWGGRVGKSKGDLLKKYGGGSETESSVEAGLKWLAKHQSSSGYWDAGEFIQQCSEKSCSDTRSAKIHREAISAFCVLAFLGAGHHEQQKGPYQETVGKALRYLESQQNPDGSFGKSNTMYAHAIVTLALCEAKQFDRKTRAKDPYTHRAIQYILDAQTPGAGWRYYFRDSTNDTSVTGWCIMALKAGREAKIPVPAEAFQGALSWIESCTDKSYYGVGYTHPRDASLPMTAVGVACRFFLGQTKKDPAVNGGINYFLKELPVEGTEKTRYNHDYYYWYYGTLATFQYGGESWEKWNSALKKALLPTQATTGCERGSWGAYCRWFGPSGGRPLNTAISILMLEIYYRYPHTFR